MKQFHPTTDFADSSSSLIARAGQIMVVIITLGLVSMISSMLVTESLNGDAAQINNAGSLRMQAIRISRAAFAYKLTQAEQDKKQVITEVENFNIRLSHLLSGNSINNENDQSELAKHKETVLRLWANFNDENLREDSITINALIQQSKNFDQFVLVLDKLVQLLQLESEKKLSLLRLIQVISLLLVILTASFVLIKLNRAVLVPLKELVNIAEQVGKGNFSVKARYDKQDELGVLAHTINQMSDELKLTYQEFEHRVDTKTLELTRSNKSLDLLYRAAHNLAGYTLSEQDSPTYQINHHIIEELQTLIGYGKINIEITDAKHNNLIIDVINSQNVTIDTICNNYHKFALEKGSLLFGYLVWELPKNKQACGWQKQILQGMANIMATAIELDQKRTSENRLVIVEERAVIARELHDSLAQSLSYLKVQMSLLTRKMQKQVPQTQLEETINDIKDGLNSAYSQLRELLTTFRLKLDDPSIKSALASTVIEFSAKCQHTIEFDYQLPANYLSANQEIHLLQIVREALSNIHRHAQATIAGISIKLKDTQVTVKIWDNGKGFPESTLEQKNNHHGHFGIGIMQERAKSLNTKIHIANREERGSIISFEFFH
ncbi:histidine kinase [Colwellia sp. MSW7]|jgi:two-component system nitrate/nitrite sensor histidine kinase NarX|uniref:Sensor protein n=1 Tax=Colwellia maritima TaxID=2912588 RepID=A0ABS9WYB9_9GAMM|nr:histidine kinase [Colwellia maritima]MCI2282964.1 histidine kinase [Colwellia maritima]